MNQSPSARRLTSGATTSPTLGKTSITLRNESTAYMVVVFVSLMQNKQHNTKHTHPVAHDSLFDRREHFKGLDEQRAVRVAPDQFSEASEFVGQRDEHFIFVFGRLCNTTEGEKTV